ncbi:F-box/FBD/LRR-repeat protein At1g13570-like [Rutidosis leptorrhynchoides]|uniref:F-box/FBD/LRR-repeat protein At1g13570-like n=1 Tax=Rutidosis leptorrhynchoides TaxID=125765 RepID=UPI003A99E1EE
MPVTSAKTDSLSKLPDNLVDSILERLPIQDVVRTSILSRNWRYKWTTMWSLVLDKRFSNKLAKNDAFGYNGFIRVTNQLFHFLKGPIVKVHLHIPKIVLDSFQEVDQWILSLSRDGVRELFFKNSNKNYQLPSYLFECSELRRLELNNCIFKPPLEFRGFLSLSDLRLENITFGENLSGTIIKLPQLKKLSLVRCRNVYNFNIVAIKLQFLMVMRCFDAMFLRLLRSRGLTRVYLLSFKPITLVQRVNLATILSKMPYLVSLSMDGCFLKKIFPSGFQAQLID